MAKEILHMRIDATLKAALKELADKDSRNLSNFIEKVLQDHVQQHQKKP